MGQANRNSGSKWPNLSQDMRVQRDTKVSVLFDLSNDSSTPKHHYHKRTVCISFIHCKQSLNVSSKMIINPIISLTILTRMIGWLFMNTLILVNLTFHFKKRKMKVIQQSPFLPFGFREDGMAPSRSCDLHHLKLVYGHKPSQTFALPWKMVFALSCLFS